MNLEEVLSLKRELERLKKEHSKLLGVEEEVSSILLEEFKCNSLEQAKKLLSTLKSKEEKHSKELEERVEDYQNKYGNKL